VLECRNSILPVQLDGYLQFAESMKAIAVIPGPIHHYLSLIGVYQDAVGRTVIPSCVLPVMDKTLISKGVYPSDSLVEWKIRKDEALSSMFPYGFLEREIHNSKTAGNEPRDRFVRTTGHADAPLVRPGVFKVSTDLQPVQARRAKIKTTGYDVTYQYELYDSIRFNVFMLADFVTFCQVVSKKMRCYPYPQTRRGSPAQQVVSVPTTGTAETRPTSYEHYSFQMLSAHDQQLSRVFLYRIRRFAVAHRCYPHSNAERSYNANASSSGYRHDPPLTITDSISHDAMRLAYIRFFFIIKT